MRRKESVAGAAARELFEEENQFMDNLDQLDAAVPGGVYLCQISETISCGACCGLYNLFDASPGRVAAILEWRTLAFAEVPRRMDDVWDFMEMVEARENQDRPFPHFHHCPCLGLVGERRSRVGCLLHPLGEGNNGVDLRGLSYYGGMACRTYFCPTYRHLSAERKQIIRAVAEDWYGYGLIITEWKLLSAVFDEIESRMGRQVTPNRVDSGAFRTALQSVLRLKREWPFRIDPNRPASYFFEDGNYPKSSLDLAAAGGEQAPFGAILEELESVFDSPAVLQQAEMLLDRLFAPFGKAGHPSLP